MKYFLLFLIIASSLNASDNWEYVYTELSISPVNDFIFPENHFECLPLACYKNIYRLDTPVEWNNVTKIKRGDTIFDASKIYEYKNLALTGKTILASIKGGNYIISDNKGNYWKIIENLELGEIKSFYVDSNDKIYAGTDKGIFISIDFGYNWKKADTDPVPNDLVVNRFKMDENGNLWGCIRSGLIKRESNYGKWSIIKLDSIIKANINDLTFFLNSIYLATDSGLIVSPSDGSNYKRVINNMTKKKINTIENSYGKIYAGADSVGVFLSIDSANTWHTMYIYNYETVYHIKKVIDYNSSIIIATSRGLTGDHDHGEGFINRTPIFKDYSYIHKSFFNKSTNDLLKYHQYFITNESFILSQNTTKDNEPDTIYLNYTTELPQKNHFLTACSDSSNNIYYSDYPGPLYRSDDRSIEWTIPDSSIYNIIDMLTTKDGSIFAVNMNGKVYCSRDNGLHWKNLEGLDSAYSIYYSDLGQILLINKDEFTISHDNGNTWTTTESSLSKTFTDSIKSYGMIKNTIVAAGKQGIYYTKDFGKTWSKAEGAPSYNFNTVFRQGDYLYASCDSGIYMSGDKGATWSDFSEGLPKKKNCHILCSDADGYIYLATDSSGLYRSKTPVLGIAHETESKSGFIIYPNPTRDIIQISHPEGIQINEVEIADILGSCRHVQAYESGSINLNGLEPGTYFARIKTNKGLFVERFVLLGKIN